LAIDLRAGLSLLDERDGRIAAERAGLHVTGVLGILLRATKDGDIPALRPELEALRHQARFFIAQHLEEQILRIANE
jgi:predicted nucleic acid-binding protein